VSAELILERSASASAPGPSLGCGRFVRTPRTPPAYGPADSLVFPDTAFHGPHIRSFSNSSNLWYVHMHTLPSQFFQFMVSAHAYPTFELSNAAPLLAKRLVESESCSGVRKAPPPFSNYVHVPVPNCN